MLDNASTLEVVDTPSVELDCVVPVVEGTADVSDTSAKELVDEVLRARIRRRSTVRRRRSFNG